MKKVIDPTIAHKIDGVAWDLTIGTGELEWNAIPDRAWSSLDRTLGRKATSHERKEFKACWLRHLQGAAQP
jgi:hypothetical protein